jgi:transcriptional regulator with XRE-family HTH domain
MIGAMSDEADRRAGCDGSKGTSGATRRRTRALFRGLPCGHNEQVTERTDLGEFLQDRRGRVQPETVGIDSFGRRRVRGLRREELASLAGVSVDYYVRLEQGRAAHPSEEVLDAIACALALDDTERIHLHRLGRPNRRPRRRSMATEVVRPGIARLLEGLGDLPAFVLGRRLDLIAWTNVGRALISDVVDLPTANQRNLARLIFLDPAARDLLPDWEQMARETAGLLRLAAGRNPHDPEIANLVEELLAEGHEFRRFWADLDVARMNSGARRFHHPAAGDMTLSFETLAVPDESSQMLVIYTAVPGSRDAAALEVLAEWAASATTVA